MATREDLEKFLAGLTAGFGEMRGLVERMEAEYAAGAPEDAILNAEAVSVMRAIAINARDLRTVLAEMGPDQVEAIIAECRDPEIQATFLGLLKVPRKGQAARRPQ